MWRQVSRYFLWRSALYVCPVQQAAGFRVSVNAGAWLSHRVESQSRVTLYSTLKDNACGCVPALKVTHMILKVARFCLSC